MSPDLKNWLEAANLMMLSTNNSLEATNNVFKRDFTQRKRISMPHLFETMKDLVEGWSINPKQQLDRVQMVSPTVKIRAEELLKKMEDFLCFRKARPIDRATVKPRGDLVTGELKQVGICPRQNYVVTTLDQYNQDAKNIVKRRRQITYSNFNQFRKDLSEIAVMEVIRLDDGLGKEEIFCNCLSVTGGSGSKGDICIHVCARYFNVLYKVL